MANLRKSLEAAELRCGERIEAMVVGEHYDDQPRADENVVISRNAGLTKVDEEYCDGFGGADCFPLYAWTASYIFLVHEYDGATKVVWVPRHPVAVKAEFGGQNGLPEPVNA